MTGATTTIQTTLTTETLPVLTSKVSETEIIKQSVAGEKITDDGFKYYITNGFAVIEEYDGSETDINIPKEIDTVPVKEISYGAFSQNKNITSITIPESVERIGHDAFAGCENLSNIVISNDNTTLEDRTF